MLTLFVTLLYLVGVPYLGLMVLVIVGMFRPAYLARSRELPSVTVILPAHNEENSLPTTLASLAAQRYDGELEFVLVDDRSSDRTRDLFMQQAAADSRFTVVSINEPSSKLAPKVNAVDHGIRSSHGEIVVATDADCNHHPEWVASLVELFTPEVGMVVGYVESSRRGEATTLLQRFESVDWFTLMLVSRSLTRFGMKFASSANNLAYRRSAFEAAGGFGASGRAPSGDEDLLTQKLGRLPGLKLVFAEDPRARVHTQGATDLPQLLRQRRRWVSRYHHTLHYHLGFMASIAILGAQSVLLTLAVLLTPFFPALLPWVAALWAVKVLIELIGMGIGTAQLDRRDLWGLSTLWWALWHPAFIAVSVVSSFIKPSAWHAGAVPYRRRFLQRRLREFRRRLRDGALGG